MRLVLGLFAFGFGTAAWRNADPPRGGGARSAAVFLLALALWLAYRSGRRSGGGAVAIATATAAASSESAAVATGGQAAVNVYVGPRAGDVSWEGAGLAAAPWLAGVGDRGEAGRPQSLAAAPSAIVPADVAALLRSDRLEHLDPAEAMHLVMAGDIDIDSDDDLVVDDD